MPLVRCSGLGLPSPLGTSGALQAGGDRVHALRSHGGPVDGMEWSLLMLNRRWEHILPARTWGMVGLEQGNMKDRVDAFAQHGLG